MELDINKVLDLYKQRISELEHELILLTFKCQTLTEEIEKEKYVRGCLNE